MNKKQTAILIAAIAGLLFTNSAFSKPTAASGTIKCIGGNSCKGQSACQTASSACKGMNSCKGKGYVMASVKTCKKKGGRVGK